MGVDQANMYDLNTGEIPIATSEKFIWFVNSLEINGKMIIFDAIVSHLS